MSSASKRKIRVTVNGKAYTVEVGSLSESPLSVSVNGVPYVVEIASGAEKIAPDQPAALETVARSVSVAGPSAPAARPVTSAKDVTAPMPGQIVEVLVQAGAQVKTGDTLCTLEAMKMKNSIRSHRDGTIAKVEISPGQKVAHGDVLVTFE